jgi:hypothetical protein
VARELFIYYRVRLEDVDGANTARIAFHDGLRSAHPELVARCLCRPEITDGRQTWMETYSIDRMAHPDGISSELQAEIEARAATLRPFIDGARHTEVFIACAS